MGAPSSPSKRRLLLHRLLVRAPACPHETHHHLHKPRPTPAQAPPPRWSGHSIRGGPRDARALRSHRMAQQQDPAGRRHPSPFAVNLLAGGGAGVVETTLTYPLDLVRTRLQMHRTSSSSSSSPGLSPLAVLRGVVREEGMLRLYRGLLPPLVSEVPRRALKFTANDAYTGMLLQRRRGRDGAPSASLSVGEAALAGTLTGMTETVLHTPFEVVKVRLQAKEFSHCRNSWDCAGEMLRLEGPASFYRGFEAYLYRQGVWNGAFFMLIALVRETWPLQQEQQQQQPAEASSPGRRMVHEFWTGLVAGSVATVLNTPLDVAKTRIQCMRRSPWCLPVLAGIYREEGFRACFRGLDARLYRAAPGSGILLVGYEAIKSWLVAT